MAKELFSHFAVVLPVSDLASSIEFYVAKLGFKLEFEWGDPTSYAILRRGEGVQIHLSSRNPEEGTIHPSMVYIFIHDIELLHQHYVKAGIAISEELASWDYGMKEFAITDPDGHVLTFGMGT
ncbi:MAG: VOC family protein [Bacteroidia bacterium]|nr:VOC family protein [Bacteroidia bacterium]